MRRQTISFKGHTRMLKKELLLRYIVYQVDHLLGINLLPATAYFNRTVFLSS